MPVSSFECQIARGQIGRYLGGGALSPEAMKGLEEHLAECPTCKALVAERRAELMGQLGGAVPTQAVVSMPARTAAPKENPLIAALRAREGEAEPTRTGSTPRYASSGPRYANAAPVPAPKETKAKEETPVAKTEVKPAVKPLPTKPLALTAALAVVLLGMNYMTRSNGGKGVLGNRASDSFAAQQFSQPETKPTVEVPKATDTPKTESTLSTPTDSKPIESTATTPMDSKTETKPKSTSAASTELPPPSAPKTPEPTAKENTAKTEAPKTEPAKTEPAKVETAKSDAAKTEGIKKEPVKTAPAKTETKPKAAPIAKEKAIAPAPKAKPAAKPTTTHTFSHAKPAHRSQPKPQPKRSEPRPATSAVRVYGPDGKPINP